MTQVATPPSLKVWNNTVLNWKHLQKNPLILNPSFLKFKSFLNSKVQCLIETSELSTKIFDTKTLEDLNGTCLLQILEGCESQRWPWGRDSRQNHWYRRWKENSWQTTLSVGAHQFSGLPEHGMSRIGKLTSLEQSELGRKATTDMNLPFSWRPTPRQTFYALVNGANWLGVS